MLTILISRMAILSFRKVGTEMQLWMVLEWQRTLDLDTEGPWSICSPS